MGFDCTLEIAVEPVTFWENRKLIMRFLIGFDCTLEREGEPVTF